eukprot:TRINITY_DN7927_c0_g1_i2.p1 TRINITY_DN7927_c0_g1~~TRINITY_DN7927_c0_g1_i2.p1  ORF type:complete len:279 (-),score=39.31 TRINITY_DN7927_c0_g1_i2:258-1094(-)
MCIRDSYQREYGTQRSREPYCFPIARRKSLTRAGLTIMHYQEKINLQCESMGNSQLQNSLVGKDELKPFLDLHAISYFPYASEHLPKLRDLWSNAKMRDESTNPKFFETMNVLPHTRDNYELAEKIELANATESLLSAALDPEVFANLTGPEALNGTQIYFSPNDVRRFTELQKAKLLYVHVILQANQSILKDSKDKIIESLKENLSGKEPWTAEQIKLLTDMTLSIARDFQISDSIPAKQVLKNLNLAFSELSTLSLHPSTKMDLILDRALDRIQKL